MADTVNDDKYIGIEVLVSAVNNWSRLFDERTQLFKKMWEDDTKEEKQAAVSSADAGGISGSDSKSGLDLSAIAKSVLPISDVFSGGTPTSKMAEGGVVGTQPFFQAPSIPSPMAAAPKSLKSSGFDDALYNKIDASMEEPSASEKIKKAFQDSLQIPAQAAMAALLDAMANAGTFAAQKDDKGPTMLREGMKKISSAFNIPATAPKQDTKPAGEEGDKKDWLANAIQIAWNTGSGLVKGAGGGERKDRGDQAEFDKAQSFVKANPTHGQVGDPPLWSGRQDMGYGGSMMGDGRSKQSVRRRGGRGRAKTKKSIAPMNLAGAAPGGPQTVQGKKGFMGNLFNAGKTAFSMTPMGMMAGAGMNLFKGAKNMATNLFQSSEQQTNLTELTENVIKENAASRDRKSKLSLQTPDTGMGAEMPIPETAPGGSKGSKMDQGSADALPKIKHSPYFAEYNKTATF